MSNMTIALYSRSFFTRTGISKAVIMSVAVTAQICTPISATATPSEWRVAAL